MPNYSEQLDLVFHALADPTRRMVVERLTGGAATVAELAESAPMSLPSFVQHLGVLEKAGLVKSNKSGRVRTYELVPKRLQSADDWMATQRSRWNARLEEAEQFLDKLQ